MQALRRRFPDAHLTYLVEPRRLRSSAGNPHLTRSSSRRAAAACAGCSTTWRSAAGCAARRFDLAIDFHGGPRASLLTWLSGARVRIGYEVAGRSWMYTPPRRRGRASCGRGTRSSISGICSRRSTFRRRIRRSRRWKCRPTAPRPRGRASVLRAPALRPDDPLVVIHVSAGNPFRRWPAGHFVELVIARSRWTIRHAASSSRRVHRKARRPARVIAGARARLGGDAARRVLSCGEFSLAELRALLDRAALYIGGDSGPLHIAGDDERADRRPVRPDAARPGRRRGASEACVTESVDAGPLPCRPCDQRVCEPGDFRCLTSILPAQVFEAATGPWRAAGQWVECRERLRRAGPTCRIA